MKYYLKMNQKKSEEALENVGEHSLSILGELLLTKPHNAGPLGLEDSSGFASLPATAESKGSMSNP